jgi:uncharacterized membrane protein YadS
MDPSAAVQTAATWLVAWTLGAVGLTVGVSAFLRAAHHKERLLPETKAGLRAWIHLSRGGGRSRAA